MEIISNLSYLLGLEITPKQNTQEASKTELRKNLLQTQQQLIRRLGTNLTISLRYIYDPDNSPKLKTYFLINHPHNTQTEENSQQILSLLTKGKISEFFTLTPQPNLSICQNLDWVQIIGEILKHEELIEPQNYYLPHFFEANPTNDMSAVCDVIHRLNSKLILEITLQTHDNPNQKSWVNAINQMLAQLEKVNASGTKDNLLSVTLALYQKYQQLYPSSDLFQYSIKALAENWGDASVVLSTLIEHATKETPHGKQPRIVKVNKSNPAFSESLEATKKVEISTAIEWEGWQKYLGQMLIKNAIEPPKKGLGKFSNSSPNLPDKPSFSVPNAPLLTGGINSEPNQSLPKPYDAVLGGSALAKLSSTPPPSRIVDLKPLHRLASAQEITGFFRIAVSKVETNTFVEENVNMFPDFLTIENLIKEHSHLITEDRYIVGIDQKGKPCISDFSKIPHRIVAGVPGSGKTNFITSVIYQFLYANPERKIYIADFQAGMHYQLIVDQQPSLEMVTELDQCANLLNELWKEHETRRELMREKRVRSLTDLKEKHDIKKHRIVLIIDEAFYIQNAERKTRESIEKNLMGLAAQARVTGIHIIYCSQRPTPEVIPSQISDNMDERLIFRVQPAASQRLLDDDIAASLPVEPRGRAVYRGLEAELKIVATPLVPDEIWEN
jgi:hypothetical protein